MKLGSDFWAEQENKKGYGITGIFFQTKNLWTTFYHMVQRDLAKYSWNNPRFSIRVTNLKNTKINLINF